MLTLKHLLEKHLNNLNSRLLEADERRIYGISIPHLAAYLSFMQKPFIAVEDSAEKAEALLRDIALFNNFFRPANEIIYFPEHVDTESAGRRASILSELSSGKRISIITSVNALSVSADRKPSGITIKTDMEISRETLRQQLLDAGYSSRGLVVERGEFSERGWVFDIYPSTEDLPARLEFLATR